MYIRVLAFVSTLLVGLVASSAQAQPYGGGYEQQQYGEAVDCRSSGYNYQRCEVPWRDARLVRQLSDTQCVRGRSWGFDPRGGFIWVDRGCAGRFVAGGGYSGGPGGGPGYWQPGPGWDRRFEVACGSSGYNYQFCAVDVGGAGLVRLARQNSNAACIEGRTWGWNRGGVWVDQGCSGQFLIERRWR
jgi:hypothetical protein